MFATVLGPYPRPLDSAATDVELLTRVLADQLDSGLGMVSDGVVRTTTGATAADLEMVVDAWRRASDTVRDLAGGMDAGLEPPLVKACLVGPYSALRANHPGESAAARRRETLSMAEAVHAVVEELFRAGAPVVQLAEDALTGIGAGEIEERELAAEALRRATDGLSGHLSLSVAGGDADAAGAALFFDAPFASYLFDLIRGPDNWRLITQAPRDRGIICGVADTRPGRETDEAVMVWAARYAASSNARGLERVGLAPSAGLELRPREEARSILASLAEAARKAGLPGPELAGEIDPRAVDARSGALGRYDPEVAATRGRSLPGVTRSPEERR